VIAGIVALAQLGVSVASLVAGLGIGGLAVALGAQKTLENLFGTLSIGVDQPMREGDFVKLYDFLGTVEQIGLRSTRIRTLDRTIVTIPNGELANQRIESYTARDRLRLATTIGVVYQTTSQQMRAILGELEAILRRHPKIWPDGLAVEVQGARRVVARHRDRGVVPDLGLGGVPGHPAGRAARLHGRDRAPRQLDRVPDPHHSPRERRTGTRAPCELVG